MAGDQSFFALSNSELIQITRGSGCEQDLCNNSADESVGPGEMHLYFLVYLHLEEFST